jgi:hypothetical protein
MIIDIGPAQLDLRDSIALRECLVGDEKIYYLCLYDDEIDRRADEFSENLERTTATDVVRHLELTDAAFIVKKDGELLVLRGGACVFPLYHSVGTAHLCFTTSLPLRSGTVLSASGIVMAAAAACQHSSYEPNAFTETPIAGLRRIRRSSINLFCNGQLERSSVIADALATSDELMDRESIATQTHSAFMAYGRSQSRISRSLLEVSGGFDSTLSATTLQKRQKMEGISSVYPYYEFRSEIITQERVAEALSISRTILDGAALFPYAPSDEPVQWDEPSVYVTGIRHAEQVARFAAQRGVQRIYTGHGGDQCFATDLTVAEGLVDNPPGRGPFSRAAWQVVSSAMVATRKSPWMARGIGTFVYDARQDVWVKARYGGTLRTPFSDLQIFRSGLLWSKYSVAHGVRPDKSILVDALGDYLPSAILERKGKVAYDGVWMRAYERHADHISDCFDRSADALEHLGISAAWLIRRARALGRWRPVSDREVLALYAIAFWLLAWDIRRPTEFRWAS